MYIALFVSDSAKINAHTVHVHVHVHVHICTCNIYYIGYTVSYMCISKLTNEKLDSPLSLIITIWLDSMHVHCIIQCNSEIELLCWCMYITFYIHK